MFWLNSLKLPFLLKIGLSSLCLAFVFASCGSAPVYVPVHLSAPLLVRPMATEPGWTRAGGLHGRFNRQMYLTAVGHGSSRQAAEMDAFRALVSIFGVTVQADTRLAEVYRRTGAIASHDIYLGQEIILGTGMDNLIGAEIGDRWTDGRGHHVALAVLNRARATQLYSEMIRANQETIASLVTFASPAERVTLSGFSRYRFAAVIADMNTSYAAVLSAVGAPQPQGLRTGDHFRRDAQEIARSIPIGVNVVNDRAGRIQGAFARSLSDLGFRTGGANPRYLLDVNIDINPTDHQATIRGQPIIFTRIEVGANLIDTSTGTILLPYNFNFRGAGHRVQSEAENLAFNEAVQRIDREYTEILSDYLSRLIPTR